MEISPSLTASVRKYIPFRGRFEDSDDGEAGLTFGDGPSFWWPADRAWFVSTDIDISSTYVGGSAELAERLLADELLEVFPAELDDPIDGSPHWK